jgi:hypothetical protein
MGHLGGPVNVVLALAGDEASSDDLRGLRAWLVEEDELRGHVRTKERAPEPGVLGPVLEALEIVAQPENVAALVAALIAWLRSRRGNIRLDLYTEQGKKLAHLDARQVKTMDADGLVKIASQIPEAIARANELERRGSEPPSPGTDR